MAGAYFAGLRKLPTLFGKLTHAFDKMTESLRNRKGERQRERCRSLFENMLEGFVFCRMLFEHGQPRDFVYLSVNRAFENLTGLKDVTGKKVSEAVPGILESDPELFRIFGRVALTGILEKSEVFVAAWQEWFAISVYCPQKEHFIAVFDVISERKAAEEARTESEELYRITFELAGVGIAHLSPYGRWLRVNRKLCEISGYSREELLRKQFHEITHPDDLDSDLALIGQVLAGEIETYTKEKRYIKKDGSIIWISLTVALKREDDGRPKFLIAVYEEITERKEAQDALRENEERFRLAMQGANEGLWDVDLNTDRAYYSPRWKSMLGYAEDELECTRHTWKSLIHPDDLEPVRAMLHDLLKGRTDKFEANLRMRHREGHYVDILSRAFLFRSNGGDKGRLVGTHVDITELKRTEQALRDSEERLSLALSASQMGVWEWDAKTGAVFWSPECCNILGVTSFGGKLESFKNLVYPKDINTVLMKMTQTLRERTVYRDEFRIIRPDGKGRWVSSLGRAEYDPDGEPLRMRGITQDITERKQLEEQRDRAETQLRQAQKLEALGTLAGGVAHDFNNILGIVMGFTELSKMQMGEESAVGKNLQEVLKACKRAQELVRQILAFCRMSEQRRVEVQIGLLLKEAMKMIRASLPSTIEVKTDIQTQTLGVADPTQIHQVLMNLCTNASHAMPDGGVLSVSLTDCRLGPELIPPHSGMQPGQFLKLAVTDTGHGISPADMGRIFDPFFTTKDIGEGTGLGLSVVNGIVESHGGTIDVNSSPGEGTSFTVFLPASDSALTSQTVEAAGIISCGKERILVVDDEPLLAEMVQQMLTMLGYDAVFRTAGIEALEAIRHQPPQKPFDLVITDMTMPYFTGTDLARELSGLQPEVPVILMTGFSNKIDAEKARELGIQGFLMKPAPLEELAGTVRTVLDRTKK